MGKGGYLGGSTVIRFGSDWFSYDLKSNKPIITSEEMKDLRLRRKRRDKIEVSSPTEREKGLLKPENPSNVGIRLSDKLHKKRKNGKFIKKDIPIGSPEARAAAHASQKLSQDERMRKISVERRQKNLHQKIREIK